MGGDNSVIQQPALPNITGTYSLHTTISSLYSNIGNFEGAFFPKARTSATQFQAGYSTDSSGRYNLAFDASLSNPIYGNSNTVQPPTIQLLPQIKY